MRLGLLAQLPEAEAARRSASIHVSTDEVFGSLGAEGLFCERQPVSIRTRPTPPPRPASDHLVARLAPDLRPADDHHQLLQQLRPLSFPREADPADDPQRARGQAAAGLRARRKRPRLALRRGSRRGAAAGQRGRRGRTNLTMSEAAASGATSTSSKQSATSSTELRPLAARSYASRSPSSPTGPGTTCATPSIRSKIERELGWRPRESFEIRPAKTVRWYLDNPDWWGAIRSGAYRGERLGLRG